MKKFFFSSLTVILIFAFFNRAHAVQELSSTAAKMPPQTAAKTDGKIRFTFQEQDWKDVIPWFADQAGYSLQPVADWPEGTFTLKDDSEYTVMEALDQLNHALSLRKPEPYTLILNRKMLVLWKTRDTNFPNDLIETVKVEDLDKRGKYEIVSCIFKLGELKADEMFSQLQPMIGETHRNFFAAFPMANQLHIRETGGQLRDIRDVIEASRNRQSGEELKMKVYRLRHQDSDTFMLLSRAFLGIDEGANSRDDGMLAITVEPLGDRLFVRGTDKWLKEFESVASVIDGPVEDIEGDPVLDRPYLKSYGVFVDPKLAIQVVDTMLAGRDNVRMDQDEITGAITFFGRADDHQLVRETLDSISDISGEDFAIIALENGDPQEIIVVLQSMYRQTAEDTSGPVLMANSDRNQILVRGTPQEVADVKKIVTTLDANSIPLVTGPRTTRRVIPMNESEQDDILPMLEDLLHSLGRENKFNIVMPEERANRRSRIRTAPTEPTTPLFENPDRSVPPGSSLKVPSLNKDKTSQLKSMINQSAIVLTRMIGLNAVSGLGCTLLFQDDVGSTSGESSARAYDESYQPAPQRPSVPGAPIEVKMTAYGLVLDSDDLDALDDLEDIIYNQLGAESSVQLPQFFPLNHRRADEMLGFLETYYGMADSGGSGAGGMMTGMMNNMMGGGAGDLLGGLLGTGTGGTGGAGALEGDVRFGVDMPFNMVYVAGATGNDLDEITALIDTLDRPEAPHTPGLIGEFRTIDIIHRDPTEVKELIEMDMAELLDTGESSKGGGQNNEGAQMMKMMQQIAGGGRKGGAGSANHEEEKPTAKLGVDPKTRQLLVTGPLFIYEEVLKRVIKLDRPELSTPPAVEFIEGGNADSYIKALQAMFGDKIELFDSETDETKKTSTSNPASSTAKKTSQAQQAQQQASREAMMKMIQGAQQRAGGAAGRGGAGGGGGPRGGGARGGR